MRKPCDECGATAVRFDPVPLCADHFESHHLFYERIAIKLDSGIDLAAAMRQATEEMFTESRQQRLGIEVSK